MLDIHTHYDVEVLNGPSLSESLRHGVTTVMLGSCSLSTVYVGGADAGDLFGRVEAIPRHHVIAQSTSTRPGRTARSTSPPSRRCRSARTWPRSSATPTCGPRPWVWIARRRSTSDLPGANRPRWSGCSPRRWTRASSECPPSNCSSTSSTAISAGRGRCRRRTPSRGAAPAQRRLRRAGRVLQAGPDIENPLNIGSRWSQSLGIFRQPLKTSLLSAADVKANPFAIQMLGPIARLVNRLGGDFRWQHLPVPFEVYADGIDLVIFEEFGSGAAALHLRDEVERNELMRDEDYRRQFRKDYESKFGMRVWHRDFFDAEIVGLPRRLGDRQVVRPGRRRARRSAPRRRVPRPGARARHDACGGAPRSPTTVPRCSRSWRGTPASRSASPTPARTCATWRSTTSACACCATSATPRRRAGRS